ncbi:g2236 [Coccomyxa elongata]
MKRPHLMVGSVDTGNLFSAFTDSNGGFWAADFNFLGGNTEGSGDAVANATGGEDAMYSTNRVGPSFLYSFGPVNQLMPEETYNVTLFFNELYWSRAGQRLFNVSANNETRLVNFDIFKSAGGKDSATNVTIPVKLGPMAQLVLQFDSVQDQASVAGISVSGPLAPSFKLQSFLQNDTASPADSYGPALVRIDTGALKRNFTDSTGAFWHADRSFSGGGIEVFNAVIANTTDGSSRIYDTNRVGGSFSYSFSAADGLEANQTYTVVLHAADLYWSKPRQRIFSVGANGATVLKAFDVIAAGGPLTATQVNFTVTATADATILLQWFSIKDQAIVGAIEIYGPPGAIASPELVATDPTAAPVTAPVMAPAFEPVQAPEALTALAIPGAYSPVVAPVYGSTSLQPSGAPASAPVPSVEAPQPYTYSGMPAYAARAPSPTIASPPAYSPPAYGARPPAYGSYGGAF